MIHKRLKYCRQIFFVDISLKNILAYSITLTKSDCICRYTYRTVHIFDHSANMRAKAIKNIRWREKEKERKRERNARVGADNSISGKRSSPKSVTDLGHWFVEACWMPDRSTDFAAASRIMILLIMFAKRSPPDDVYRTIWISRFGLYVRENPITIKSDGFALFRDFLIVLRKRPA